VTRRVQMEQYAYRWVVDASERLQEISFQLQKCTQEQPNLSPVELNWEKKSKPEMISCHPSSLFRAQTQSKRFQQRMEPTGEKLNPRTYFTHITDLSLPLPALLARMTQQKRKRKFLKKVRIAEKKERGKLNFSFPEKSQSGTAGF